LPARATASRRPGAKRQEAERRRKPTADARVSVCGTRFAGKLVAEDAEMLGMAPRGDHDVR